MIGQDQVVLVPWYEPDDFARLHHMHHPRSGAPLPASYERWHEDAKRKLHRLLATGVAAQIVRMRVDDYLDWLSRVCVADTVEARLRYLAHLAGEAGCQKIDGFPRTSESGVVAFD